MDQTIVAWRYKDTRGHWRYVGNQPDYKINAILKPEPLYSAPAVEDVQRDAGWVSVKDRLPEDRKSKLVYCQENFCTYSAWWNEDHWRHFGGDGGRAYEISHWREMPPPPAIAKQEPQT